MRYSQEAADAIVAAAAQARNLGHSFVGSIHLLMALCACADEAGMLLRSAAVTEKFVHDAAAVLCGLGDGDLLRYKKDFVFTEEMAQELRDCAELSAQVDLRMDSLRERLAAETNH